MSSYEGIVKRYNNEVQKYQDTEKDKEKLVKLRQQLESQLTENTIVKEELDIISAAETSTSAEQAANQQRVYKLVGGVLVQQDVNEALQNVQKRIDYINGEIKRHEGALSDIDNKKSAAMEAIQKLQQQLQQIRVQNAIKTPA